VRALGGAKLNRPLYRPAIGCRTVQPRFWDHHFQADGLMGVRTLVVCLLALVMAARAESEADELVKVAQDYMATFRRIRSFLSAEPDDKEDWSLAVLRASSKEHDLVPQEAFGLDLVHRTDELDECQPISMAKFADMARKEMWCGNSSFCGPDDRMAVCPAVGAVDSTSLEGMMEAGALDCYVPVHIVPPDSPELMPGCDVDVLANFAMVHAGWALEHTLGGASDLSSSVWHDGVAPPSRAAPTRHKRAHARFARELAVVAGAVPVMEARRAIVECGICHTNHDGAVKMAAGAAGWRKDEL